MQPDTAPHPMTRRRFLKTSTAAVGTPAMARSGVRAQAQATDSFKPFSFLHFSDAHLSINHVMNKNYGLCQMRMEQTVYGPGTG